jgi:hypothetical protein
MNEIQAQALGKENVPMFKISQTPAAYTIVYSPQSVTINIETISTNNNNLTKGPTGYYYTGNGSTTGYNINYMYQGSTGSIFDSNTNKDIRPTVMRYTIPDLRPKGQTGILTFNELKQSDGYTGFTSDSGASRLIISPPLYILQPSIGEENVPMFKFIRQIPTEDTVVYSRQPVTVYIDKISTNNIIDKKSDITAAGVQY